MRLDKLLTELGTGSRSEVKNISDQDLSRSTGKL